MERLTNKTCEEFLGELASKAPVPGGGGAAALVGAVGMALGNMVGNLTTGKKKYAAVEQDIQQLNQRAEELRKELERLVTADAEVFEPLSKAYGLPKSTPEEIAYKDQVMEDALEKACAVPMQIMMRCCDALDLIEEYAEKGSVMAVSDAGCAAVFCKAALQAASLNVFINTKAMKNRKKANQLNLEADVLLITYQPKADAVFDKVTGQLQNYRY
jgi:formiminotetrahydrofolate cyclodeaminase